MDQENKIALVVGFGVVLFVGILISDHLSKSNIITTVPDIREVVHAHLPQVANEPEKLLLKTPKIVPPAFTPNNLKSEIHHSYHIVKNGENLIQIARQYDSQKPKDTAKKIASLSNLKDIDSLNPGQLLKIPLIEFKTTVKQSNKIDKKIKIKEKTYVVQEGDTLSEIAEKQCGSHQKVSELLTINEQLISNPDDIQIGMILTIPE
tara:strand:+ start:123 stop:740 length:618 start_codon:yes stop_codon:yes gene_type:complete